MISPHPLSFTYTGTLSGNTRRWTTAGRSTGYWASVDDALLGSTSGLRPQLLSRVGALLGSTTRAAIIFVARVSIGANKTPTVQALC
jgi:hypothetical protein